MSRPTRRNSEGKNTALADQSAVVECACRLRAIGDSLNLRFKLMEILLRRTARSAKNK